MIIENLICGMLQEQDGNVFDGDVGFDAYPFGSCL